MKQWVFGLILVFTSFSRAQEALLFYCGATMVPAMQQIAKLYTQTYHKNITIIQGSSGDLLQTLTSSGQGDLYLPGDASFLDVETSPKSLFAHQQTIAHMRLVLFTRSGHPESLRTLGALILGNIRFAIGSPESSSIGKATQKMLLRHRGEAFARQVNLHALYFANDSRDMRCFFDRRKIDAGITWAPSINRQAQQHKLEILALPLEETPRIALRIAQLTSSHQPAEAQAFIRLIASKKGQEILRREGYDVAP